MNKLLTQISLAKEALLNHQVVAFPTETVMGLGVIYNDYDAYLRLNEIKNRPEDKPYTLMVKDVDEIDKYAFTNEKIKRVIDEFMPGPLTILLKSKDNIPGYVTHNTGIIGIRIPTNIEALSLLKEINIPLLVPSANKSGEKPALNSEQVKDIFLNEVAVIIDGVAKGEQPSTIIDLSSHDIKLIRNGPISFEGVKKIYGKE